MTSTRFSFDTIQNFDIHIAQSIEGYSLLFKLIQRTATFFTKPNTNIIDIGCSTGILLESIKHPAQHKIGIDISTHLLPENSTEATYWNTDIRTTSLPKANLILSIFTLQFINPEDRQPILNKIYESLHEGGAFIWAEKTHHENGKIEQMLTMSYYQHKRQSFTAEQILDKEQDLRTQMTPNTSEQNLQLARNAGFTQSTILWKINQFEAWVHIK